MRASKELWNAASLCFLFVFLILATVVAPHAYKTISVYFDLGGNSKVAKHCKPLEQAFGNVHISKSKAQLHAIANWSLKAEKHGVMYSLWTNAEKKNMKCRRMARFPAFNCAAKASPCKNLGLDTALDAENLKNFE